VLVRVRPLIVLLAIALAVPLVAPIAATAQSRSLQEIERELAQVQQERSDIEARVAEATAEIERLEARIAELEQERDVLTAEVAALREELEEIAGLIAFRVRETFKYGANLDPIAVFLGSDDPEGALSRAQVVQRVVAADQAKSEALVATRTQVDAAEERLAERSAELASARERQEQVGEQLQADFARVRELEDGLTQEARAERERIERERREREERERRAREARERAERERQQAASASTSSASGSSSRGGSSSGGSSASSAPAPTGGGGMACPLDQPRHFSDSWGAPRSGGRGHRGTDIMGPHGIPVRAITSGTWSIQSPGASAGLWGILRGDDGNQYWYMHLSSHTVGNGARVSAGQQVGTNGATGNAPPNAPHVHFELHPGGGSAVNPYSLLRRVCG
jgi:peptidoglycan LD-endopeptidase LytH